MAPYDRGAPLLTSILLFNAEPLPDTHPNKRTYGEKKKQSRLAPLFAVCVVAFSYFNSCFGRFYLFFSSYLLFLSPPEPSLRVLNHDFGHQFTQISCIYNIAVTLRGSSDSVCVLQSDLLQNLAANSSHV